MKKIFTIRKIKNNRELFKNLLIIGSFLIIAYLSMALMLKYHFIPGSNDQFLHINRIAEIRKSLSHLSIPQFGYSNLHGSAIMTLYPYINLIPFALLSFIIKSKVLLIYISFGFYVFLTLLICYYNSFYFNKSKYISYLFAIIYSMSIMYINYIFVTADFAEPAVLTWMPLIIFGFLKLIKTKTKWVELSIGMTLIIGTHVLSAIIAIILIAAWIIMNVKTIRKRTIISICKATIVTALVTMVIWLPAILFIKNNPFFLRPKATRISDFAIPLSFLVKGSSIGWSIEGIDIFAVISIFLGIMFFLHFNKYQKQMFIISLIIVLFCSKLFPWQIMPKFFVRFFDLFQFTTRFYIVPQVMLNYLFAVLVINFFHTKRAKIGSLIIVLLLAIGLQIRQQYHIMSFEQYLPAYNQKMISNSRLEFNHIYYTISLKNKRGRGSLNFPSVYRITNNQDYRRMENAANDVIIYDYWPSLSSKKLAPEVIGNHFSIARKRFQFNHKKDVKSKGVVYHTNPLFKVYQSGFHRMNFYNPSRKKVNIMLPLFRYHGEKFKLYDNHKKVRTIKDADTINIKNAPRKENHIKLVPKSSYKLNISRIFSLIGCLIYIIAIIFYFIKILLRKEV